MYAAHVSNECRPPVSTGAHAQYIGYGEAFGKNFIRHGIAFRKKKTAVALNCG